MNIPNPGEVGVKFIAPPVEMMPKIMGDIEKAVEAIGDYDFAMVAVADRKGGWNAAAVLKGPKGLAVTTWIGKQWGDDNELDYGAQLMWKVKF